MQAAIDSLLRRSTRRFVIRRIIFTPRARKAKSQPSQQNFCPLVLAPAAFAEIHALRAPIDFFFDGLPEPKGTSTAGNRQPSQGFVYDFFASAQGLTLAGVFIRVRTPALRRRIVKLVEEFAAGPEGAIKAQSVSP